MAFPLSLCCTWYNRTSRVSAGSVDGGLCVPVSIPNAHVANFCRMYDKVQPRHCFTWLFHPTHRLVCVHKCTHQFIQCPTLTNFMALQTLPASHTLDSVMYQINLVTQHICAPCCDGELCVCLLIFMTVLQDNRDSSLHSTCVTTFYTSDGHAGYHVCDAFSVCRPTSGSQALCVPVNGTSLQMCGVTVDLSQEVACESCDKLSPAAQLFEDAHACSRR